MDKWQSFRFLIWPFIVGSATIQCMYVLFWLFVGTRLRRYHAIACMISGFFALIFAVSLTRQWENSSENWMMFTLGLCILAGVLTTVSGLLVTRIWREN